MKADEDRATEGTITPDDMLILVVLAVMLAGVLWLAWYMFGGTDDVVGLLRR